MSTNRMVDQINAWREDLINLNRNNRLLYFRKTKSSTLEVLRPGARDLLSRLSNGARGVTFWEPPEESDAEIEADGRAEGDSRSFVPFLGDPSDGVEPRESEQARRKRSLRGSSDDGIVCDVTSRQDLLKTLRWLERRTAQEFMDKGLWILYLGVGILDWIEQPRDTGQSENVSSPILLIPVRLSRDSARAPYQLHRAEEDPAINPALAFKLNHDFGITLPMCEDQDEDNVDEVIESVRNLFGEQPEWVVRDAVVLSVFSFHKEVMYRDLQNNEEAVAAHPIVQSLALSHRADKGLNFDPVPEDELDEQHPPESMISILDCDASQRQCLVAAAVGQSFVMEGPPGTGKSQTIANMVADALGHNKTVLFVSEKAAALEVVQTRLERAGLREFVLALHSHKATRKHVAQTLGRSLTTRLATRSQLPEVELQQLINQRGALTAFAKAMNERREPVGMSVYDAIGELVGLQRLPQAPASDALGANLTAAGLAAIYDAAGALARAWGPVERGDDFLWRSLVDGTLTQARRAWLLSTLERALAVVEELESGTKSLSEETGLPWRTSLSDTRLFAQLLTHLATPREIPTAWLWVQTLDLVKWRCETLLGESITLAALIEKAEADSGARWRELREETLQELAALQSSLGRSPLHHLQACVTGSQGATALAARLRETSAELRRGYEAARNLAALLDLPPPQTAADLRSAFELGSFVFAAHKPAVAWLNASKLPLVRLAVDSLQPLVSRVKGTASEVERLYRLGVLEEDVDGLQLRFEQVHRGLGKLRPAYWRDRRVLRAHAKSGKIRKEEVSALRDAVECKRCQRELTSAEARHASSIGQSRYQSVDTDFDSLLSAIGVAEAILKLAAGRISQERLAQRFSDQAEEAGEVVLALSGVESWSSQFINVTTPLGPEFERLLAEQTVVQALAATEAAAVDIECIGSVLSTVENTLAVNAISIEEGLERLRTHARIAQIESVFVDDNPVDRELLGPTYVGLATAFDELKKDIEWADRFRMLVGRPISTDVADRILRLDVAHYGALLVLLSEWIQVEATVLGQFNPEHRPGIAAEFETPFEDTKSILGTLAQTIDDISEWGGHSAAVSKLTELGMAAAVRFCNQKRIGTADVSAVLRRAALESWVDAVRKVDSRLLTFLSKDRDHLAQAFRELDRRFVEVGAARVIETCNAKRPTLGAGAAGLIAAEANKQKRHMPIRRLIELAAPVVQALKPCMMMSPLSVSQFLPPTMRFDVVIFDEASQVKPADAINCIYRGRQLVIAGDQMQLPPTPFFDKLDSDSGDEWTEDQLDDFESVLDVAKGSGALQSMALRWHYRSQHEDLITYSNYSFYEGRLVTFPSANTQGDDVGVEMFVVPGVYRRGGARDNPD